MRSLSLVSLVLLFPTLAIAVEGTPVNQKEDCGCSVVEDLRVPELS